MDSVVVDGSENGWHGGVYKSFCGHKLESYGDGRRVRRQLLPRR